MNDIDNYRDNSPVTEHKDTVKEIVNSHWNYMRKVIENTIGEDATNANLTMEEYMAMRKWDYTSAMTHGFGHGVEVEKSLHSGSSMSACVARQKDWAIATFGPGDHSEGLLKHIKSEVIEIREDPSETEEWVDIIILAMEGAWRTGASPEDVAKVFDMKMSKNERRSWPSKEDTNPDEPIEHLDSCGDGKLMPYKKKTPACEEKKSREREQMENSAYAKIDIR